jgi:hypothetical protein
VKVFQKKFKNDTERYYIMFLPDIKETEDITRSDFMTTHSIHWELNVTTGPSNNFVELKDLW